MEYNIGLMFFVLTVVSMATAAQFDVKAEKNGEVAAMYSTYESRGRSMMRMVRKLIGALIVAACTHAFAESSAAEHVCESRQNIKVYEALSSDDLSLICEAAKSAVEFLAGYNIIQEESVAIEITNKAISSDGYSAYGTYDRINDRIRLMSLEAIMQLTPAPTMYEEPFDREHYSGAVAHEVAHAVVQQNMTEIPISPSSQEYLAHATQLAVLPNDRRRAIIARVGVDRWLPGDAISDIYMAMEPTGFAVKSFLHLTTMAHPEAFVKILLGSKWFYVYVPDEPKQLNPVLQ